MAEEPTPFRIDILTVVAGALAATTSALVLSTLGAGGTLIGAAVGSVTATIGSALYTQGLARSRHRVLLAQQSARRRTPGTRADPGADPDVESASVDPEPGEPEPGEPEPGWRNRLAALHWKRIAAAAAGVFLVVIVLITAFELISGRSVSSITGGTDSEEGTTIGRVTGGGRDQNDPTPPDPTRSTSPSPSDDSSATAGPSDTAPPSPTDSSAPSPSDTVQPSATATEPSAG